MKLFFDENLSFKLTHLLENEYPGSIHTRDEEFQGASDDRIWEFCKEHNFIIVSKDTDFRERSFMEGYPPKIIWLDVGNADTGTITELLKAEYQRVKRFSKQQEASLLILSISKDAL